MEHFDQ